MRRVMTLAAAMTAMTLTTMCHAGDATPAEVAVDAENLQASLDVSGEFVELCQDTVDRADMVEAPN